MCGRRPAIDAVVCIKSDDTVSGPLVSVEPSVPFSVAVAVITSGIGSVPNVSTLSETGTFVEPGAGETSGGPLSTSAAHTGLMMPLPGGRLIPPPEDGFPAQPASTANAAAARANENCGRGMANARRFM